MKRAALYVRVSTKEQMIHGLSIDNQIDSLVNYCNKNGYEIADIYNDAGFSASKRYTTRPEMMRMIGDCRKGLIDIILFIRIDRWFRSIRDYYEVQSILEECNVQWKTIWEYYDNYTANGMFNVNIMLSVAQSESDRTSERIKSVLAYKRDKGEYSGRVPPGYILKERKLVRDPDTEEGIRKIFEAYIDYRPIRECIDIARKYGLPANRTWINRMTSNPVYIGMSRRCGGTECEPYLTEDQWEAIQSRKKKYIREPKLKGFRYYFNGLTVCGLCGKPYNCRATVRRNKTYVYLHCTGKTHLFSCNAGDTSEIKIESYLLSEIENIIKKEQIQYRVRLSMDDENTFEEDKKRLEQKMSRIGERYEDGDITREEYVKKRDSIKRQIESLKKPDAGKPPELPDGWKAMYKDLSRDGKSSFWHRIIERIVIMPDGKHDVKLRFTI